MKRLICIIAILASLAGCGKNDGLDMGLKLRNRLLQSTMCSFQTEVSADYGDRMYAFSLQCEMNSAGDIEFVVLKPDSISGITGSLSDTSAGLTFEDKILAFPMIAGEVLTPVSAPMIFIHALRGGYINAVCDSDDGIEMIIHDTFQQTVLEVHVTCDRVNLPCCAEIFWEGRRIITLQIKDFAIM